MALTKIDISARNKTDIANHYLGFFNVGIEEKWMKKERMLFFFYKSLFLFLFHVSVSWTHLKTEYNPVCKLLTNH